MAANSLDMTLVRQVLDLLTTGIGPMETARQTGVSKTTVYKIHHSVGGVYRPQTVTYSKRYLDRDERYEIARLRDVGNTITDIAAMLGRSKSTVSRELDRNANPETGRYEPERAERLSWERQRRPKSSKLSQSEPLREEVQEMLKKRYSPDQLSGRLKVQHPMIRACISVTKRSTNACSCTRGASSNESCRRLSVAGRAPGNGVAAKKLAVAFRMRCRSTTAPKRSRAGSCPVTTKAT